MRLSFLILAVIFHGMVIGQSNSILFRNISINEGLSQSSVVDIAADNTGFLWFATQDGLNRYDGKEFQVFKKNFDDITTSSASTTGKLAVGNRNDLWLISSGGKLERMNLYDQTVVPVTMLGGIQLPPVSCIYPDGDNLWIGTETRGLFVYNLSTKKLLQHQTTSSFPVKIASNEVNDIFKDKSGQIWVLTAAGVTVFKEVSRPEKTLLKSAGTGSTQVSCGSLTEDSNGSLWLGTYGKGLMLKRRTDSTFTSFCGFNEQALPQNLTVFTILADQLKRIWIGTYGQGLYIINPADSTITHILSDKKNSLSLGYNDVLSIRQDKNGGIWIGTDGGGVSYYDRRLNNFSLYSTNNVDEDISIEQIRSITTDQRNRIWVGTSNNGLTYLDPANNTFETIHFSPVRQGVRNHERIVSLLTDNDGDIWVGSQGNGLLILNPDTRKIKKQFFPDTVASLSIPDHTVWCMLPDGDNVWIGTRYAGLSLINKHTGVIKNYIHRPGMTNSLAENNIRKVIFLNDTTLCVGFEKKGVQFFNTTQEKFFNIPSLDTSWRAEVVVKTLYFQHPLLWIGTLGKGIITYNVESKQVVMINEENGLPNHTVYGILPDRDGALWISSNKGICRFRPPSNLKLVNRSHFTVFAAEDGLQSNEFNTGAYHQANNGSLFFGGIRGLNILSPEKMVTSEQPINTAIIRATVNNEPYQSDTNIVFKKILHLKSGNNSLAFNFAALDFASANKITYYYQLDDYEKNWINAGNRSYASYTNLPPGRYLFKVKASHNGQSDVAPVTTLSIVIDPPFWRTWWFLLLAIAAVTGVLYALYRYRINQLIALQKVRNRIATDLHDDIGSTLTNISILSELSKKNMQNEEQTKNFLNRISEEVYFSNQALDDIVWSINTSNDTLEQTVARMRRYAAEVFDIGNISYSLQLDEQFERYKLNMDQRRDCFLLFKEAINNIYKHAHAKHVSIKVWVERSHLYMEIVDDGKGFDTSASSNRNGIKNMHSRIEKRNGSINIRSGEGKGTCTEIAFPL